MAATRQGVTWVALAAVTAVVASVTTVGLVAAFTDTANSPYATEIDNVAGAGCATGFPNGKFKPNKDLRRGDAAAWLNRCGGRVAYSRAQVGPIGANPAEDVTQVQIRAGAVGAGTGGFVTVSADLDATDVTPSLSCPCAILGSLDDGRQTDAPQSFQVIPEFSGAPTSAANMSLHWVVPVEAGEVLTITLRALHVEGSPGHEFVFEGDLVATYVPFGPDGDNTLAFDS